MGRVDEVGLGLLVATLLYGFRHGFDFDHLAALGDISGSSGDRRHALRLSSLYVFGHALVVLSLGLAAVVLGASIPPALDELMGRVIGVTLIGLGLYLAYTAIRYRGNVRFRSRWMLAADGVRVLSRRFRRTTQVVIEHTHHHVHDGTHEHDHAPAPTASEPAASVAVATAHAHAHTHVAEMPIDPFKSYSARAAFGIGMIHGIGAETPSQVLLFASAAGAGTLVGGASVLIAFLVGLVVANSIVAFGSALGFAGGARFPRVNLGVALVTAALSLALGVAYALGRGAPLDALARLHVDHLEAVDVLTLLT